MHFCNEKISRNLFLPFAFGFGFGAVEKDISMLDLEAGEEKVKAGTEEEPNDVDEATGALLIDAGSVLSAFLSTLIGELN